MIPIELLERLGFKKCEGGEVWIYAYKYASLTDHNTYYRVHYILEGRDKERFNESFWERMKGDPSLTENPHIDGRVSTTENFRREFKAWKHGERQQDAEYAKNPPKRRKSKFFLC